MEQTTAEVAREMDLARQELDDDLKELSVRAKSAVDWREQVGKRPVAALGAALVGGFLLASMTRRPTRRRESPAQLEPNGNGRALKPRRSVERGPVAGALIAVASSAVARMLGDMIPGFREEHAQRARSRDGSD